MGKIVRFFVARYLNEWRVTEAGSNHPTSVHRSAENAWADARRRARGAGGEAQLNDEDGRIRVRNSYKNERESSAR